MYVDIVISNAFNLNNFFLFSFFSRMSSQFSIAILNGTSSFLSLVQENLNMPSGNYYRLCS